MRHQDRMGIDSKRIQSKQEEKSETHDGTRHIFRLDKHPPRLLISKVMHDHPPIMTRADDPPAIKLDVEYQTRMARLEFLDDLARRKGPDEDLLVVPA